MSEKEKVEVGNKRADSLSKYGNNPTSSSILPPKSFFRICLDLDDDQIDLIEQELNQHLADEAAMQSELGSIEPPQPPQGGGPNQGGQGGGPNSERPLT